MHYAPLPHKQPAERLCNCEIGGETWFTSGYFHCPKSFQFTRPNKWDYGSQEKAAAARKALIPAFLNSSFNSSFLFPSARHFWDSAGKGTGPSCLDCAFAKKGWTGWSWGSFPRQHSIPWQMLSWQLLVLPFFTIFTCLFRNCQGFGTIWGEIFHPASTAQQGGLRLQLLSCTATQPSCEALIFGAPELSYATAPNSLCPTVGNVCALGVQKPH